MKTVFSSNSEVCHQWATLNSQGHNTAYGKAGSVSFQGRTIFSYAAAIAHFASPEVVLFNARKYSVTTSAHQSDISRAIPHSCTVFTVKNIEINPENKAQKVYHYKKHLENMADYESRIGELVTKASRARTNSQWLLQEAQSLYKQAENYKGHFHIRGKMFALPTMTAIKERIAKQAKAATIAQAKREREIAAQTAFALSKGVPAWKNGVEKLVYDGPGKHNGQEYETKYILRSLDSDFLRIIKATKAGVEVETSKQVKLIVKRSGKVLSYVTLIYRLCKRCIKSGKAYIIPPEKPVTIADQYQLRSIDEKGLVTVGCHKIAASEIFDIYEKISK